MALPKLTFEGKIEMKKNILLLLIVLGASGAFSKESNLELLWDQYGNRVTGAKGKNEIQIQVTGNLKKTGLYRLPKGFGLKSIYGVCGGHGGQGDFGGGPPVILTVTRVVDGKNSVWRHKLKTLRLAKTHDFELQEGDLVYADTRIF
jgi:hypothetical protein